MAAEWPLCSQSSQNRSSLALRALMLLRPVVPRGCSSFSRSQVKISCPGLSQISHTSSPDTLSVLSESENFCARVGKGWVDVCELDVDVEDRYSLGSSGRPVFDDFFWDFARRSFSRSISDSNSSWKWSVSEDFTQIV